MEGNERTGSARRIAGRVLIVVGALASFVVVLTGLASGASWLFGTERSDRLSVSEPVQRIAFEGSGSIEIVASETAESVTIDRTDRYWLRSPDAGWTVENGVLHLTSDCHEWWYWFGRCESDYRITAPAGLALRVDTSSGDLELDGGFGELSLDTDSGDIALSGSARTVAADTSSGDVEVRVDAERVDASTSSGDVTVEGRASDVRAATRSGDVTVTLSGDAPMLVDASTSSGDVEVTVPYASYDVDVDTGSGDEDVDGLVQDGRSPRAITATTNSGDVTVRGR